MTASFQIQGILVALNYGLGSEKDCMSECMKHHTSILNRRLLKCPHLSMLRDKDPEANERIRKHVWILLALSFILIRSCSRTRQVNQYRKVNGTRPDERFGVSCHKKSSWFLLSIFAALCN